MGNGRCVKNFLSPADIVHYGSSLAMERATYGSKSLIIALALIKNHLTVEEAALAATVEVNSQIERWGEMEECE
jgi:chaperone required for assembly of F1-ATPase